MITFLESCIWDLPGNKYPSKNKDCKNYERYYPFLPDSCYNFFPAGDSPRCYTVSYEDGREDCLSRFYFPKRGAYTNPFFYLDGYEPDPIMTFIGTYAANNSSETANRIVVLATSDGGANWFAKYEFNDNGRAYNYGNSIVLEKNDIVSAIDVSSWSICKRELVPSNDSEAIRVKCCNEQKIKRIDQSETLQIEFAEEHCLKSGNVVAIKGIGATVIEKALLNNDFADNNFGNGIFYKVKVVDDKTVQLFECVSKSKTPLPARHIHSINRIKDGFIIATGEMYPQGWLMIVSLTDADNWNDYQAHDIIPFIRLNSQRDSVQRIVGAILLDNKEKELIYASDCSSMNLDHTEVLEGIPTNQMGIYKGKLADIDDFLKFELLAEVKEPSFFFKELDGNYVYCGQRGELAIGFDRGKCWRSGRMEAPLVHYMGRTLNFFVIDGKVLIIK